MKNRIRQRSNRRIKEELLDVKNSCGFYDPTPYEAIKQIILEEKEIRRIQREQRRNQIKLKEQR